MTTKKIKTIKRKPKGGGKAYFTIDTQKAIVNFLVLTDRQEKEKLYRDVILPAFSILVENLINVYKFHGWLESQDDLKTECVKHLYEVMNNYKEERGPAFAYFNIVAKHWLTVQSKKNAKNITTFVFLDDQENFTAHDQKLLEDKFISPGPDNEMDEEEIKASFNELLDLVEDRIGTENKKTAQHELMAMKAIRILADNVETVDVINKRVVMSYIRSIAQLTPKQLGAVVTNLKKYYKLSVKEVREME